MEQPGVSISRKTVSFAVVRYCRFRAFLSKSSITDAQVNKMPSVLLPMMGGIVEYDGRRKEARKSQKLCIIKSQRLLQTFMHYTLPHSWQEGKLHGMDKMPWLLAKERGIGDGDVRGKQKEEKENKRGRLRNFVYGKAALYLRPF